MTEALTLLLASTLAAPVPKTVAPEPDPLGWGYLGVRVLRGELVLESVEDGTPAAKAGLQAKDELVAVGTLTKLKSFEEVAEHISSFRPGSTMVVKVKRGEKLITVTVKLGVRPAELGPPPNSRRKVDDEP